MGRIKKKQELIALTLNGIELCCANCEDPFSLDSDDNVIIVSRDKKKVVVSRKPEKCSNCEKDVRLPVFFSDLSEANRYILQTRRFNAIAFEEAGINIVRTRV